MFGQVSSFRLLVKGTNNGLCNKNLIFLLFVVNVNNILSCTIYLKSSIKNLKPKFYGDVEAHLGDVVAEVSGSNPASLTMILMRCRIFVS